MKYKSKKALIADCDKEWNRLWDFVSQVGESRLTGNSKNRKRKDKPDWDVVDILAHLYAWHRLMLGWYKEGLAGQPDLPAKGFNWRQTPALNQHLFEKYKDLSFESIVRRLKLSHNRVMKLVASISEKNLMSPGLFKWTGKIGLVGYIGPSTAGHYRWAIKKIKKLI